MPSLRVETPTPLVGELETSDTSSYSLWSHLRQSFAVLLFFGTGFVISPFCAVMAWIVGGKDNGESGQRLIRGLFQFWMRFSTRIGVLDIDFRDKKAFESLRGVVIAPNHPSLLDAVFLLSLIPHTVCIMRADLINSPFLGSAARLAGFVPNDRGAALIRQGVGKIALGQNLLIFPEGTRTRNQAVNCFKSGFALVSKESGAPIQTVFIERHARYLSKGVSLFSPTRLPIRFKLSLGEKILPQEGESARELAARVETVFRSRLERTGEKILLKTS